MFGQYNQQMNLDRINGQIAELERLKQNYQQAPMNVFNVGNTSQIEFEARILNEKEKPEEILVQRKTMFFEPKKGKLYIKETNGDLQSYDVVLPKTEEQKRIEELERKLSEYEHRITSTNNENGESHSISNGNVKSSTKSGSKQLQE